MYELLICKSVNSTKQKAEKIDDTMRDKRQSALTLKFKKSQQVKVSRLSLWTARTMNRRHVRLILSDFLQTFTEKSRHFAYRSVNDFVSQAFFIGPLSGLIKRA